MQILPTQSPPTYSMYGHIYVSLIFRFLLCILGVVTLFKELLEGAFLKAYSLNQMCPCYCRILKLNELKQFTGHHQCSLIFAFYSFSTVKTAQPISVCLEWYSFSGSCSRARTQCLEGKYCLGMLKYSRSKSYIDLQFCKTKILQNLTYLKRTTQTVQISLPSIESSLLYSARLSSTKDKV